MNIEVSPVTRAIWTGRTSKRLLPSVASVMLDKMAFVVDHSATVWTGDAMTHATE